MATPDSSSSSRSVIPRLATAFVIGVVSLTLEIAYTRIISFKLFYYYTYFVIGLALLGLGAAGAVTSLSSRLRAIDPVRLVRRIAPIAGVLAVVGYVVVARLPTDVNLIWTGSLGQAAVQTLLLLVMALAITGVFFGVGLVFTSLVVGQATTMRRLYFWDLVGAALGCLIAVPLQGWVGPPAMVLASAVALAALGPALAGVERERSWGAWVITAAVLLGAIGAGQLKVLADDTKTLRDTDTVLAGDWGPVFRVDAVELGELVVLHHDGLWGSSIWRYDGTRATTARFDTDVRQIPYAAVGEGPRVLIIGAAGGNEIMASLTYGASHIDAVELNPITVDLLRNEFGDYTNHVVDDPRVNYVQGDGRTFLARSDDEYDLIWFVAPDSYAASNAATAGAFVLSESYLYTQEMIETSLDHLTDDGVVVAQFGDFAFDTRPTRTARYLVTARAAMEGRLGEFAQHTALVVNRGADDFERVSTIMLFNQTPSADEVAAIEDATGIVPNATIHYLPGGGSVEGITTDLIVGSDDDVATIVDDYPFEIGVIDDNRPFFWHFTDFSTVLSNWDRNFEDNEIAIGERLLVVLLGIAAVVAGICLWLPFGLTRRRREVGPQIAGRWRLLVYFAALGLGFMVVEISMIQRFALLLGFPTLSLSVSLCTLLVALAIGARISGVIAPWKGNGIPMATAALVALCVITTLVVQPITDAALSWPEWARIVLVVAMLMPIGLVMGAFLPTGIDHAVRAAGGDEGVQGRLVAWCWAVNGFFSVIGSSFTTVLSMSFGFNAALFVGVVLYLVAASVHLTGSARLSS